MKKPSYFPIFVNSFVAMIQFSKKYLKNNMLVRMN